MKNLKYDILIVGGGGAGLTAALNTNKNLAVCVISKVHPLRSQTCMAQGGMNASLKESIATHVEDTIKGGDDLCNRETVEFFCEKAPEQVKWLESIGMIFSRDDNGDIAQRPFGAQKFNRTCYSRDYTGHNLLSTLYTECLKNEVKFLDEWYVHELIVENGKIAGLYAFEISTGELYKIEAKAVILATGGAAQAYSGNVNAVNSTGDGMALAYRAGCSLQDIEFVQFHPTSLHHKTLLISEATRGEGAYLKNNKGERFVDELGPRDQVARAIAKEIEEGRSFDGAVHLDMTHLNKKIIQDRLCHIYKIAMQFAGIDCTKEPIPVKPGAHYMMGGIKTNVKCETDVEGLFAAGECACNGLHGSNRLGGNSLMETAVFGKEAGINASKFAENIEFINSANKKFDFEQDGNENQYKLLKELQAEMLINAGIFRCHESLAKGLESVKSIEERSKKIPIKLNGGYNNNFFEALELKNLIELSKAIYKGALDRKESRGAHYRTDYPEKDSNYNNHTLINYEA